MDLEQTILRLREYFTAIDEVTMVFIFGSIVRGQMTANSDVDVAIYFKPVGRELEWEELDSQYEDEDKIWSEVERIIGRSTDLIVLNRAPSSLAATILREGEPVIIKNQNLYWRFMSAVMSAAEDFRQFLEDFWLIKQRSASLSAVDRERLIKISDFIGRELADRQNFLAVDQRRYESDAALRRNLERWAENLVNATIDLAKIILASEKQKLPETYKETLSRLRFLPDFDALTAEKFSLFAKLRNILSHEYLDLRFVQLQSFIRDSESLYRYLLDFTKKFLDKDK